MARSHWLRGRGEVAPSSYWERQESITPDRPCAWARIPSGVVAGEALCKDDFTVLGSRAGAGLPPSPGAGVGDPSHHVGVLPSWGCWDILSTLNALPGILAGVMTGPHLDPAWAGHFPHVFICLN